MANPPRRLANLPGYDTAPDIYETPEPTSSAAPTDPTSPSAASASSSAPTSDSNPTSDSEQEERQRRGINKRHIRASHARGRFTDGTKGVEIEARGTDLSERVDGGRKGYGVGRVRVRESLEEKVARLKREVEECRVLAERESGGGEEEDAVGGEVEELGKLLGGLDVEGARQRRRSRIGRQAKDEEEDRETIEPDEQTLKRVVDFDNRIAALEQALGISGLDNFSTAAPTGPLLPSLDLLDHQISALTGATSLTNLEAAHNRIRALKVEADSFAKTPLSGSADPPTTPTENEKGREADDGTQSSVKPMTQDDLTKMNALYQLLPTLQSLSPTVPAMLERLRSLRTLHKDAAHAVQELEEVERRQSEIDEELKRWREGLERVEGAVKESGEANGRNGKVVESWVRELEGRMEKVVR